MRHSVPVLVLPRPVAPGPARGGWWTRRSLRLLPATGTWDDVRGHAGEPVPGGGTALLLCDLTPDADPDLVGLADRLLLPGRSPRARGYAAVVPVLCGWRDEELHPLLRRRTSAYACRFDRASDGIGPREPVPDALLAAVNAKDQVLTVADRLRRARCGTVHLVAADRQVRSATLRSLEGAGWSVALPRQA